MPPPIPRCSSWANSSLISPSHFTLPRYGRRVGLHIVLFEACSAFPRVAACTLALSPIRDTLIEGFSHFVTSMTAPITSGWSDCRVGFAPTGKRRLCTAHTPNGHSNVGGLRRGDGHWPYCSFEREFRNCRWCCNIDAHGGLNYSPLPAPVADAIM